MLVHLLSNRSYVYGFVRLNKSKPAQYLRALTPAQTVILPTFTDLLVTCYFDRYIQYAKTYPAQQLSKHIYSIFEQIADTILKTLSRNSRFGYLLPKLNSDEWFRDTRKFALQKVEGVTLLDKAKDEIRHLYSANKSKHPIYWIYEFVAWTFNYDLIENFAAQHSQEHSNLIASLIATDVLEADKIAQLLYMLLAYLYNFDFFIHEQNPVANQVLNDRTIYSQYVVEDYDGELVTDVKQIENAGALVLNPYYPVRACQLIIYKALEKIVKQMIDITPKFRAELELLLRVIQLQLSNISYRIYTRLSVIPLQLDDRVMSSYLYAYKLIAEIGKQKQVVLPAELGIPLLLCKERYQVLTKISKALGETTELIRFIVQDNLTRAVHIVTFDELLELAKHISSDINVSVVLYAIDEDKLEKMDSDTLYKRLLAVIEKTLNRIVSQADDSNIEKYKLAAQRYIDMAKQIVESKNLSRGWKISLLITMAYDMAIYEPQDLLRLSYDYTPLHKLHTTLQHSYSEHIGLIQVMLNYDELVESVKSRLEKLLEVNNAAE